MASSTRISNGSVIPKISRHPLQRIESPSRQISFLTHALGLCSFAASYWFLNAFPTPINASYGWHWQYLTIIGLLLATLTFIFGLLADITLSPRLFAAKNTLSLCSTPLEVLISVLYWSIVAYDRHLVIPPEFELNIWADIGFHAIPSILLTWDLLALSPPWTVKNLPAVGLSAVLAFSYWGWVEHCYSHNGLYVKILRKSLN